MTLLRERLTELLVRQEHGELELDEVEHPEMYQARADEIIELFVDSIKNLEFTVDKNKTI